MFERRFAKNVEKKGEAGAFAARSAANYLLVHIGGYDFAIPSLIVRQLLTFPEYYSLPQAPSWCTGMLCLPEVAIPVLDLHSLLGLKEERKQQAAVVVAPGVCPQFPQFALLVDRLTITVSIRAHEIQPLRSGSSLPFRQHVCSAWRGRSRPCYLLRMESVIPINELHLLPELLRTVL